MNTHRVKRERPTSDQQPPREQRNARPAPRTKRDARQERTAAREHTRDQRALNDKRALSGMQPPTSKAGDEAISEVLFEALMAAAEDEADTHTHGFHSYPARMHPSIAAVLLDRLARPSSSKGGDGARIVDPFCGSGTVLVEARVRGLPSWGIDLNPVALRVAEVKTEVRPLEERRRFAEALAHVVERSKERVRAKVDARAPLTKEQAARYEGHVLKELAGLHKEIGAIENEQDRRALFVVMSAILVKVSTQRSDTTSNQAKESTRRMGRFIPTEIFEKKGFELIERWATFADAAHANGPAPKLSLDDARHMHSVLTKPADLVITSPPYAGTYDYAEHHALRAPWLGVSLDRIAEDELGSRRTLIAAGALDRWDEQVKDVLRSLARALADDGLAVFVVGDGDIGGTRVRADEQLRRLLESKEAPLEVLATASAPRLDWRGGADRQEHLVALAPRR